MIKNPPEVEIHNSGIASRDFFESSFAPTDGKNGPLDVAAALVPHHLLPKRLIASTLSFFDRDGKDGVVVDDRPVTVFILSPNHFSAGSYPILTSAVDFFTPYGTLAADPDAVSMLTKKTAAHVQEKPFRTEHGIYNLVAFVKKIFRNAKVVPLIFKDSLADKDADLFAQEFLKILAERKKVGKIDILIGSFDFSHYATDALAKKWDSVSLPIVADLSYERVREVAVDSKPGLRVFLETLKGLGLHFHLTGATNASQILKQPKMTDVTSYIAGYFFVD